MIAHSRRQGGLKPVMEMVTARRRRRRRRMTMMMKKVADVEDMRNELTW